MGTQRVVSCEQPCTQTYSSPCTTQQVVSCEQPCYQPQQTRVVSCEQPCYQPQQTRVVSCEQPCYQPQRVVSCEQPCVTRSPRTTTRVVSGCEPAQTYTSSCAPVQQCY